MLKGKNELRLNEATMIAALEEYFNNRITLSEDAVMVRSVSFIVNATGRDFVVLIEPLNLAAGV